MVEASFESYLEWERELSPGHGRAGRKSWVQLIGTQREDATCHVKILAWGFLAQENWLFLNGGQRYRDWLTRVMGVTGAQQFQKLGNWVIHHPVTVSGNGFTGGWTRSLFQSINNEWEDFFLKHWCQAVYDHGPHTKQHPALLCSPPWCGWRMAGPLRNTSVPLVSVASLRCMKTILQHLLNPHCLHQVRFEELLSSPKPCSTSLSKPVRNHEIK